MRTLFRSIGERTPWIHDCPHFFIAELCSPENVRQPDFVSKISCRGGLPEDRVRKVSMLRPISRVVDLLEPQLNRIHNMDVAEARRRILTGNTSAVRAIDGSFAIVAVDGITVRIARSLDRPVRYFLAKRHEGPALYVADRVDTLHYALDRDGLAAQFHPSYTRMIPAHYLVELLLVGCPDPDPTYTRFFTPERNALPADLDSIGEQYVGRLVDEIAKWLTAIGAAEPIGVAFSGGIDSGAVFLLTYHTLLQLGLSPARLKAF